MKRLRQIWTKLISVAGHERSERSLAREMAAHLEMLEENLRREGLSPEEAKWAAQRAFGGLEQAKEQYRDQREFVWLEQLGQDTRHAFRSLRKSPGFAFIALLSLAFGIGVNTAIFTLVNGILLQRLPMPEANRVVQLEAHDKTFTSNGFSYPQFAELERQTSIFPEMAGFSSNRAVLDLDGEQQQVDVALVTGSYFPFIHSQPALGRLLSETDDRVESATPVCVLSYRTWVSRFGSDRSVLGRIVRLDKAPFQIVGVAGSDFVGAELQTRYEMWVPTAMAQPLTWNARSNPHYVWLKVLAKLRSGLAVAEAHARLTAASKGINEVLPKDRANADVTFDFVDGSKGADSFRTSLRSPLVVLMGAVCLVLLIACANLTNLLLARANERTQEFSVKLSLGISRVRLMRQLLIETLMLNLAGGVIAMVVARELVSVLLVLFNAGDNWQILHVGMDSAVFAFTFAACALITIAVGVYPAWIAVRTDITPSLKGTGPTMTQKRFIWRAMIVVQISLAVILIFAASAFSHSLRKLKTVDLGFDIEHLAVVDINLRGKEPITGSPALHDVLNGIRQSAGVDSAALSNPSMLSGGSMTSEVEARDNSQTTRKVEDTYFVFVTPQHFATLRMPIVQGRDFSGSDRKGALPVAIINRRLTEMLWPGKNPIGKQMFGGWNKENPIVVGITGNSKYTNVREQMKPIVYKPLDQMAVMGASLEVRSRLPLAQVEHLVRKMVGSVTSEFQVGNVSTMELLRDHGIAQDRLLTFLSVLFGLLGTTLALVGIYGLVSYSVGRRTREIGIRVSLGAQRHQILRMFLREVLVLVAIGAIVGLPIALALSNPLKSFLYDIPAMDPMGVAVTLSVIACGSILASLVPARRATQVAPTEALRCE